MPEETTKRIKTDALERWIWGESKKKKKTLIFSIINLLALFDYFNYVPILL